MQPETTSDGFKPIDFSDMYLFVMNKISVKNVDIRMTSLETETGIDVLMVISTDDDKN